MRIVPEQSACVRARSASLVFVFECFYCDEMFWVMYVKHEWLMMKVIFALEHYVPPQITWWASMKNVESVDRWCSCVPVVVFCFFDGFYKETNTDIPSITIELSATSISSWSISIQSREWLDLGTAKWVTDWVVTLESRQYFNPKRLREPFLDTLPVGVRIRLRFCWLLPLRFLLVCCSKSSP